MGFAAFNAVRNTELEVSWNEVEVINEPYKGSQDVILSAINSRGTADRPIRFHDNFIQGQYTIDPATEESYGAGIVTDST